MYKVLEKAESIIKGTDFWNSPKFDNDRLCALLIPSFHDLCKAYKPKLNLHA